MTVVCAKGHTSEASDYCDVCGLRIGGLAPAPSPSVSGAAEECPACGTHNSSGTRFCEECGADLTAAPQAPTAPPPGPRWEAVATADRDYFERIDPDGIVFPDGYQPRPFILDGDQVTIGRGSAAGGTGRVVDLSPPPEDTGISHRHALLVADGEGGWSIIDPGSTNGTFLNDGPDAIAVDQPVRLHDGDRLHVGAWTTITLREVR